MLLSLLRSGTTRGKLALALGEPKSKCLVLAVDRMVIDGERGGNQVEVGDLFVGVLARRDLVDDPPCYIGLTDDFRVDGDAEELGRGAL